jgi:urea transporter
MTIILNTLGVVAVGGVAIYSGWKLVRRQSQVAGLHTANLLRANVLILAGAILNGTAGSFARFLGLQSTFWLIMAVGWIVFFIGVLLTSRRTRSKETQAQDASEVTAEKEKHPASS